MRWHCACARSLRPAAGLGLCCQVRWRCSVSPCLRWRTGSSTWPPTSSAVRTQRRTTSLLSPIRPTTSASPIRRSPRCCSRRWRTFPCVSARSCSRGSTWRRCSGCSRSACVRCAGCSTAAPSSGGRSSCLLPVALFDPVRQTFLLGQVNIILALMVVADLTMDLPVPRGVLVGLAAAIKVTPLIVIPYLFMTRQGRAGVRASVSFCAAALLAAVVNASTSWSYWTHYIRDPQRAGHAVVGRQPGCARRARAGAGPYRAHVDHLRRRGERRRHRARGRCRRLSAFLCRARPPRRRGDRVVGQPGVVVAPLHLAGPSGGMARPG